ncbi:MAG: alanine--tRNA ligase [Holosporales bacterium]|nr:alanine--tRNA ligase [Holosporales bacterium]
MRGGLELTRRRFLEWFNDGEHMLVPSANLVPIDDPTLLFVNAGMVQFKDIFTGRKAAEYGRAVSSQKCVRAGGKHNDLDNVGYTARHHTFFEMLGNFSFGDYFKDEAISLAWEFLTKVAGLPPDRLLVTVHSSDEEAAEIWKKVAGFCDSRIIRISTNDNFWSMGDEGPCGPCSEIFYDHGDGIPGGPPGCPDEEDGDRYVEIWNLVFMQFNRLAGGEMNPLPRPAIDTGMGLERFSAVLQGVHSNYDIDLFRDLINAAKSVTNRDDPEAVVPHKVIADHIRAIAFLVADGVLPSNEGRGYVLRRIIRRALRYGHSLGLSEPFLNKLISVVGQLMGAAYPELLDSEMVAIGVIKSEETGFINTLDNGMQILKSELDRMGSAREFSAEVAYRLYDTYGFPFDMTRDVLRGAGKVVDEAAFEAIVTDRKMATKGTFGGGFDAKVAEKGWYDIEAALTNGTSFLRGARSVSAKVLAIVQDGRISESVSPGDEFFVVVSETPFYAESGGQAGDRGILHGLNISSDTIVEISDTTTKIGKIIVHKGIVSRGILATGDDVEMVVDWGRRLRTSRNHTATHILHAALRNVLGDHVRQKGSSVTADRLRFDFIHHSIISPNQQVEIEEIVRRVIDEDFDVNTEELSIEEARKTGAMALFGERYPEIVRVVTIHDLTKKSVFSREICGGEHVTKTSQIGCFKIVAISSVGSGVRRIEAVTGPGLFEHFDHQLSELRIRSESQATIIKKYEKELAELRTSDAARDVEIQEERVGDIVFRWSLINSSDRKLALNIIDREKVSGGERVLIVGQGDDRNEKLTLTLFVSKDLIELGIDAREIIRQALEKGEFQGEGRVGGRPDLAHLGGLLSINSFDEFVMNIRIIMKSIRLSQKSETPIER